MRPKFQDRLIDYSVAVVAACQARATCPATGHIAARLLQAGTDLVSAYARGRSGREPYLDSCLAAVGEASVWLEVLGRASAQRPEELQALNAETEGIRRRLQAMARHTRSAGNVRQMRAGGW